MTGQQQHCSGRLLVAGFTGEVVVRLNRRRGRVEYECLEEFLTAGASGTKERKYRALAENGERE